MARASKQVTAEVGNRIQKARSRKIRSTNLMVRVAGDVLIASAQSAYWTCAKCFRGLSYVGRRHPIGVPPTSNTVRTGNAWISSHP